MTRTKKQRILVIGDLMLDCQCYGSVERHAPEAACPVFSVGHTDTRPGGAANVATMLAQLGNIVTVAGVTGNDPEGHTLISHLEQNKIDTSAVTVDTKGHTTVKKRLFDGSGRMMMRVDRDRNAGTPDVDAIIGALTDVDVVVLSDYDKGAITTALARRVIDECNHLDIPVVADVKTADTERYRGATVIKGTEKEMATFTSPLPMEARALVTTLGDRGLIVVDSNGVTTQITPTPVKSQALSAAGAGDLLTALIADGIVTTPLDELLHAGVEKIARTMKSPGVIEVNALTMTSLTSKAVDLETIITKRPNGRMVFTNGCFDLLHPGHEHLLRQASQKGDYLVVGLNSDASITRLKGDGRPVDNLERRVEALSRQPWVDLIITFDTDTPALLIAALNPDVLVKGGDYTVDTIVGATDVISRGGRVEIIPLLQGHSTTSIINRQHHGR